MVASRVCDGSPGEYTVHSRGRGYLLSPPPPQPFQTTYCQKRVANALDSRCVLLSVPRYLVTTQPTHFPSLTFAFTLSRVQGHGQRSTRPSDCSEVFQNGDPSQSWERLPWPCHPREEVWTPSLLKISSRKARDGESLSEGGMIPLIHTHMAWRTSPSLIRSWPPFSPCPRALSFFKSHAVGMSYHQVVLTSVTYVSDRAVASLDPA